jgi:hypothetical protein
MAHILQTPGFVRIAALFTAALLFLLISPVYGEYTGESVIGRYDDFDIDNAPTVGMGLFPTVVLPDKDPTPKRTPAPVSSGSKWVTISPFSGQINGEEAYLIVGYMSGTRTGVSLTVQGRGGADTDFREIESIKPDENGVFVWSVPTELVNNLFRVIAKSGSDNILSNAIRFTEDVSLPPLNPAIKPVTNPVTPVQTAVPMVSGDTSGPSMTKLTLSAKTYTPTVGESISVTGRLTDNSGKGISGATINLDETGYPGAAQSEPFMSTTTDSNGNFEFELNVKFANTVGLYAFFEGDDDYYRSESRSLTFSSR